MSAAAPSIGFDIGGQSVKAVMVSPGGGVLAQATARTGEDTDVAALGDALASLRETLVREALPGEAQPGGAPSGDVASGDAATPSVGGVGVGVAGVLDRGGALRGSPHLPLLVGCRLADAISQRLGAPVVVHNDADCAAIAEGWGGAADGCDDFLLIAIGTGIGSGLVLAGELRAGRSGFGCELGHMMVVHQGRRCGCGNLGCLEAYISETAARGHVEGASPALRDAVAARRAKQGGGFAEAVFALGASGDGEAEHIAGGMVDVLGAAIGSTVNVLDLTTIVLGGGIAPGVLARLDRMRLAAGSTLFARPVSDLDIVAASRGPLAGAIGAARLGMISSQSSIAPSPRPNSM